MKKTLKKYTIIPPSLYVNRSADEQLKRIVDEMERPGYVLVARQMGKTNLLFNAKRTLENQKRLFVYVDLSNVFETEIGCYRNIIDTILETSNDTFNETTVKEISEIREIRFPSHQEYFKSIRILLNSFDGTIVIILDEIDALRSVEYSDHIFAQIRSNYFSRTSYNELNRLTYVLSGVIEPTELIKDRNKSPFNIGDKIYLNDFNLVEHNDFINKSNLQISEEVSGAIFDWANGNPRITFDICAEIEDYYIKGDKIDKLLVEKIVKEKYLTNFDLAPIDHIRELVKSNKVIRDSIHKIHSGSDEIDENVKKKLYLYGIINSNFDGNLRLKNKIISMSLSIDWLKSIDKQFEKSLTYGLTEYEIGNYEGAIEILTDLLEGNSSLNEIESCNYFIGLSYFNLGKYDKAISYFSYNYVQDYKRMAMTYLGICKLSISNSSNEGMKILEEIIQDETHDLAYQNAMLNYAHNLPKNEYKKALSLFEKLFDSTDYSNDTKKGLNELKTLSLYYQYEINLSISNTEVAIEKLKEASKYAKISDKLFLTYLESGLFKDDSEQKISEIANSIITNKITFESAKHNPLSFCREHLIHYLFILFDCSKFELFEELTNYAIIGLFNNSINRSSLIYEVSLVDRKNKESLLKLILKSDEINYDNQLKLKVFRDLASLYAKNINRFISFFKEYSDLISNLRLIESQDIYLFTIAIKFYSESKKYDDAILLCEKIDSLVKETDSKIIKYESLVIYWWFTITYFNMKDYIKTIEYSKITKDIISNFQGVRTSMIDEEGINYISKSLKQIEISIHNSTPIKREKKIGRNERIKIRYNNGTIKEGKFKHFEEDILIGKCTVIE